MIPFLEGGHFECVGTPHQLFEFSRKLLQETVLPLKPLRISFDIDNTLVKHKHPNESDAEPIHHIVTLLKRLEACGHTIILYTARKMRTYAGNSGAVLADVGLSTFQSLKELGILFHEIYFRKSFAHVYTNDSAVNPIYNFTREFGFDDFRVRQRRKRSVWSGKQRQVGSCLLGEQFKLHKESTRSHLICLALDGSLRGSTSVIWVSFACSLAGTSGTMVPGGLSVSAIS
jgi:hypothetical protein